MVYCAYCGKSFTRKEHLERHIPSHTNVKPHRCSACQLSFARRDLLQRHHSTYHEARDPMEPLPGGVPTVAGRTPIACQNCANAKTGCDKRVPCSRCAEKKLPCAARFARRSSKAAVRAAQASAAAAAVTFPTPMVTSPPLQGQQPLTPAFMDLEQQQVAPKQESPAHSPPGLDRMVVDGATGLDMCLPDGTGLVSSHLQQQLQHNPFTQPKKSLTHTHGHLGTPGNFSPTHARLGAFDEFMGFGNAGDFVGPETSYQDLIWADYPMNLDMGIYASPLHLGRPANLATTTMVPPFTTMADLSDISSSSEPMTVSSSSRGSIHTRGTSILSNADNDINGGSNTRGSPFRSPQSLDMTLMDTGPDGSTPEFEVVVAAEAAWPLARCTPPIYSGTCPRTALVHLECLEQKSRPESAWTALELHLESHPMPANAPQVVPLTSRSREKMLALTQSFLHKALDVHRASVQPKGKGTSAASPGTEFNFLVLPPSRVLEYFLRSYVHSLSNYFPLVVGGVVDPNEMLDSNQASTLLVLLMIAQGAASVPMSEARYLSAGLTETCRISLFDIIEKNVEFSADPTALRCALLFTLLGAWGGDKWQMDISMGQRSMYLAMLRHAGMLERQPSMITSFHGQTNVELQWRSWLHREAQNRLVYNWAMVDQELSLFHDTAPVLSISDLNCPLPSSDLLWMSPSSERWVAAVQSVYGSTTGVSPQLLGTPSLTPSLCELFQDFLHDNLARRKSSLSPLQLRLLLHPLQSLLCHLGQMLACLPDVLSTTRRTTNRTVTKASTLQRLEEVQAQLQHWYELSISFYKANPGCVITRCNLVLYHLISLNAVSNFPEIERLARREGFDGSYWELGLRHKRCIYQREEAIFHCGQVLRLLRQMPTDRRPSWWSAALYRAVLILWADSICHLDSGFKQPQQQPQHQQQQQQQQQQDEAMMAASRSASLPATAAPHASTCAPSAGTSPAKVASSPVLSTSSQNSSSGNSALSTCASSSSASTGTGSSTLVAIDQVTPEDQAVITYLWGGDGVAVLTRSNGTHATLDKPAGILTYGIEHINEATSTRISDGIRRKLQALAGHWNLESLA